MKKLPKNVTRMDDQTYRILDGTVYVFLLLGEKRALLIDTGMSQGKLEKILPELTNLPITVINTHGHIDHVASNYLFDKVILNQLDEEVFKEHTSYKFASFLYYSLLDEMKIPKIIQKISPIKNYVNKMATIPANDNRINLPDSRIIDLGGRTIRIIETPGHTPGSICLLDVERKILFSGDMVCDRGILLNLAHSESVQTFQKSIKTLKDLFEKGDFNSIYPSHHTIPLACSFLDDYLYLSQSILNKEILGKFTKSALGDGYIAKYKSIAISYKDGII
jgi:glyoxylase-like metal-dependent hydrolase (beta-lactamase superfamily II)